MEDGFGLAAVAGLFAVVAAFTLGDCGGLKGGVGALVHGRRKGVWGSSREGSRGRGERGGEYLAGFVLCDFVLGVFLAVFALAVGAAGFGDVDLGKRSCVSGMYFWYCSSMLCFVKGGIMVLEGWAGRKQWVRIDSIWLVDIQSLTSAALQALVPPDSPRRLAHAAGRLDMVIANILVFWFRRRSIPGWL